MKHQYFGDVNDYLKYALLRALGSRLPGPLMVCWMLTPEDDRSDGSLTGYLSRPEQFRAADPDVFDLLAGAFQAGERRLDVVERAGVVTNAAFYSMLLRDESQERAKYFSGLWKAVSGHSAIFFDPDNGLAPPSVVVGRRHSSKYLDWDEFAVATDLGLSAIVYQHFPRVRREDFLASLMARTQTIAPSHAVSALYSARVAYLIAATREHAANVDQAVKRVQAKWAGRLRRLGAD